MPAQFSSNIAILVGLLLAGSNVFALPTSSTGSSLWKRVDPEDDGAKFTDFKIENLAGQEIVISTGKASGISQLGGEAIVFPVIDPATHRGAFLKTPNSDNFKDASALTAFKKEIERVRKVAGSAAKDLMPTLVGTTPANAVGNLAIVLDDAKKDGFVSLSRNLFTGLTAEQCTAKREKLGKLLQDSLTRMGSASGVVHLDFTNPDNVFVKPDLSAVKYIDFGVSADRSALTAADTAKMRTAVDNVSACGTHDGPACSPVLQGRDVTGKKRPDCDPTKAKGAQKPPVRNAAPAGAAAKKPAAKLTRPVAAGRPVAASRQRAGTNPLGPQRAGVQKLAAAPKQRVTAPRVGAVRNGRVAN